MLLLRVPHDRRLHRIEVKMPIELAAILGSVTTVSSIVDGSIKIINTIRGGFGGANNEAKRKLEEELVELRRSLMNIGVLAESADSYLAALEEVRRLDVDALLLEQFLDHNRDTLKNHLSPTYEAAWKTAEQLVDTIDRDRGLPTRVHLARNNWFDRTDAEMVGSRLNDVNGAFVRLVERVKVRHYDGVGAGLDEFRKPVREVDVLLHDTLAEHILSGLRRLRQPSTLGDAAEGALRG